MRFLPDAQSFSFKIKDKTTVSGRNIVHEFESMLQEEIVQRERGMYSICMIILAPIFLSFSFFAENSVSKSHLGSA